MTGTGYTLQSKPGALLEASRNPKMKRAVMKAIGMPMKPKKRKAIKMSGKFQGKSNMLGQGGRAAQLKARGVPGGVIGNLARAAHAAPGQKNFHKKKIAKKDGEPNNIGNEAAKSSKRKKMSSKRRSSAAPISPRLSIGLTGPNPGKITQANSTPMMAPGKGYMPKGRLDAGGVPMKKAKKRKSAHSYKNLGKFAHKKAKMTIANSEGDEGPLKKGSKKKSK